MVTISNALSVARAESYYENEYTNPEVSAEYYEEKGGAQGEWFGTLAAEWGLEGAVTREQFYRAIEGQHPASGEQLVKHVAVRKYDNKYGKEIETSKHRAGWDATFSAPKSLVILAYMSGDPELKKAIWEDHIASVKDALAEMEKYACARIKKDKWEKSGNMIAAVFHHERARPDDKTGYAAPAIHTHAVVMNMTKGEDGKVHAMQEREFFKSQGFLTAVYRIRMAERVQRRGIELRVDRETGAPEAKWISREYIEAASPRSDEIDRKAKEMQGRLGAEGRKVRLGAGLKQAAARLHREGKKYDKKEMEQKDAELEAKFGFQAHAAAQLAREQGPIIRTQAEIKSRAGAAVTYGIERVMEREAVGDYRKVMTGAIKRNMLFTTYDAIAGEVRKRQENGELVEINRPDRMTERTSRKMVELEQQNLRVATAGKGTWEAMATEERARKLVAEISYRQNITLNSDQHQAVLKLLESRDRIVALQGRAGVGKTTAMKVFREAAERSGYAVCGIAPTGMASKELGKSGIRSQTLASFLSSMDQGEEGKRLIVLDESSLSDTKRINALFKRIGAADRLLLVGDRDQHQAVEAGAPFEQFQKHRTETVWIKEVVRQQEPGYKQAVELLQEGKFSEAVNLLIKQGRVIEIKDDEARIVALGERFVVEPAANLAVVPGNRERVFSNAVIHGLLQAEGLVNKEDHPTVILTNREDMTSADKQFASAYKEGEDIIRYRERSKVGVKKGEYAQVISTNYEKNTLTVKFEDGRTLVYDPRLLYGVEIYREAERNFSVGDRIQFRRQLERQVVNGELATIEQIEDKKFTVRTLEGQRVTIDTEQFKHFDHGYAITSFLSQGQTSAKEIVHIDTRASDVLVNRRMARVALTRGVKDILIITNSIKDLVKAVGRQKDKEIALDALRESDRLQEYRTAEREIRAEESREADRIAVSDAVAGVIVENGDGGLQAPGERVGRAWKSGPETFKKKVTQYQFTEWEKPAPQKLVRVKRGNPCPVCDKTDWCSVSADGAIAICMRVRSDHESKNGGYVHILSDVSRISEPQALTVEVTQHARAEIKRRDEVYQELLSTLKLTGRDRENLLRRGLDETAIEKLGYKSVPSSLSVYEVMNHFKGRDFTGIPGFYKQEGNWRLNVNDWYSGFLVPVRDINGRIEGFQIRRAEVKPDEPRYVWLSSSSKEDGSSSGAPAHFRNPERVRENGQAIITEGALKGDTAAHLLDGRHCVIALAGVGSFQEDFGRRLTTQLPELRQVVIAFDADAARNSTVQHQLERLGEALRSAGLDVRELKWEESRGKGLDDYLLSNPAHRTEVQNFLKESRESIECGQETIRRNAQSELSRSGHRQSDQGMAW